MKNKHLCFLLRNSLNRDWCVWWLVASLKITWPLTLSRNPYTLLWRVVTPLCWPGPRWKDGAPFLNFGITKLKSLIGFIMSLQNWILQNFLSITFAFSTWFSSLVYENMVSLAYENSLNLWAYPGTWTSPGITSRFLWQNEFRFSNPQWVFPNSLSLHLLSSSKSFTGNTSEFTTEFGTMWCFPWLNRR